MNIPLVTKLIPAVVISATAISMTSGATTLEPLPEIYPLCGIVTEIAQDTEPEICRVTITCANGNEFCFYADTYSDWELGDLAACIMDSAGTPLVYDDIIVCALYAGGTEQLESFCKTED